MELNDAGRPGLEPSPLFSPVARRVVKLLVFALVVHLFVLPQVGGVRRAWAVLGSVNPLLIGAAVALEIASPVAYARLTQVLLPVEEQPRLRVVFGTVLASTGVNHVVPGGAATTAAVNYRLLGAAGVGRDSLGFALGTQAIGSAIVLNVLLWVALIISIPTSGFHPLYATAAGVGAVLIGGLAVAVIAIRRGQEVLADRVARAAGRVPRVNPDRVRSLLVSVAEQLDVLASDRRRLWTVFALGSANWLLDAAALWVSLSAFGTLPGADGLLVAYGLANVMATIPISPGGLGVVEAILIPTLVAFGTPATEASIGVVVYRLVGFWMPIPIGALAYAVVGRMTGQHRRFTGEVNAQLADGRGSGER